MTKYAFALNVSKEQIQPQLHTIHGLKGLWKPGTNLNLQYNNSIKSETIIANLMMNVR